MMMIGIVFDRIAHSISIYEALRKDQCAQFESTLLLTGEG